MLPLTFYIPRKFHIPLSPKDNLFVMNAIANTRKRGVDEAFDICGNDIKKILLAMAGRMRQ